MQEVELRLVANNKDAVRGVKELQQESQKLYTNNEKAQKKEKGLIADIEKQIDKLKDAKRNAYKIEDIEKYNRKIKEAEQHLKEYNEAGLKFEKTGNNMNAMISRWALSLGGAAAAFSVLKEAVLATTAGMNAFNTVGALTKQVLYNLVSGTADLTSGLQNAYEVQKKLNKLRLKEKIDLFKAAEQQAIYNKYYFEASDRRKTDTQRIEALNKAMDAHNKKINLQIENIKEQRKETEKLLQTQPGNEKLLLLYAEQNTELLNLEGERYSGTKRIEAMRTAMIEEETEKRKQYYENLNNWLEALEEEHKEKQVKAWIDYFDWLKKTVEEMKKKLEEMKRVDAEVFEGLGALDPTPGYRLLKNVVSPEQMPTVGLGWNQLKLNKTLWDLNKKIIEDGIEQAKNAEDQDLENKQKRVEAIKQMISELASAAQDITQRAVEDAQRTRELLDTQISETQQALDTEVRLYEAGYASNVSAKKKQLEELKALRTQALLDEEEAIKRQKQLETVMQTSALITASAQTIKAFPGPLLPIAIGVIAAMFGAFAAAKLRAKEVTKLSSGGHGEVRGRLHSEGGEPFLNHVEIEDGERWGVLSRTASRRYGKVFANMVDNFNRGRIPLSKGMQNNIILNTDGTNSRLERVESQLIKLNQYFEGQEMATDSGSRSIVKKGNTVKVIRRS